MVLSGGEAREARARVCASQKISVRSIESSAEATKYSAGNPAARNFNLADRDQPPVAIANGAVGQGGAHADRQAPPQS
jgi:hypothetical protein